MGPDAIAWGILVPIVAIVGGIASGMLRMWTKHQQEMARINASRQTQNGQFSSSELETLRQEIAQLREVTTQYDMSVDRTLHETQQRLTNLESKLRATNSIPAATSEEQPQRISMGGS